MHRLQRRGATDGSRRCAAAVALSGVVKDFPGRRPGPDPRLLDLKEGPCKAFL